MPDPVYQQDPSDSSKVMDILNGYRNKNFVQRILNRTQYPTLPLGNGAHATHLMAWGEVDGKYIVYPTVVQDPKTKKLKQLKGDEAIKYAMDNGEYIPFVDPKQAEWFSSKYKSIW